MNFTRFTAAALVAVFLTACAQTEDNQKQTAGTIVGAGLGALAGSQIGGGKGQLAAVAIGAFGSAWLGGEAGKSLDRAAFAAMATAPGGLYSRPTAHAAWLLPWRSFV
jgi:uncharacterized protein YcfJ